MVASIEIWDEGFNLFEVDPGGIVGEYTAKSDSTGTLSDFTHKKKIVIITNGTNVPENYQVKITVLYNSEMQSSFEDIRFNTETEEYIDYLIESYTESGSAEIWLELPDAIVDPGNDTIYMYYGNAELTDGGVGDDTFVQYHASTSTPFKMSNVISPPFIIEGRLSMDSVVSNNYFGASESANPDTNDSIYLNIRPSEIVRIISWNEGSLTAYDKAGSPSSDSIYKTVLNGTNALIYRDDVLQHTVTSNVPTGEQLGLFLGGISSPDGVLNHVFIRKYIANEPTVSFTTSGVVTAHTGTTVDVAGTLFTIDEYIGYSIKFTDGALDTNGYVITSNDTNTITCSAADFSTLVNGEAFKIVSTGKNLSSTGSPVTETTISSETVQTLTQSYNYGFDDLFILNDTGAPVTEVTISIEDIQTLTQSYNYGFDDLFTLKLICIISGNVKDNVGHNLHDVNIVFENDTLYVTTTDSDGNYSQTVNVGIYNITASVLGGGLVSETESVNADDLFKTQDFVLDRTTSQDKGVLLTDRNLLQKDN